MSTASGNEPTILPVGTAIVTRVEVRAAPGGVASPAGTVGVIVRPPVDAEHSYRVRMTGGEEIALCRSEFHVLKHYLGDGMRRDAMTEYDLYRSVIYRCIVGSRAYGLESDASDVDRRGIYLPPAEVQWSLWGVPEQLENPQAEECYWELQKFLVLALKANPNVLEVLYSPIVELATPLSQELLDMRSAFLSRLVYQTYNGYVISQFKKLDQDIRNRGQVKWKHAMHLVRLLLSGIAVLRDGTVPVRVTEYRERLLEIRGGRARWDEVNRWRLELHKEFDAAFQTTRLPDRPDYEAANAFLVKARRSMVK